MLADSLLVIPKSCTVHRASFPPSELSCYLQSCLISLSHTALPDHSGRSFSLPDTFSLLCNTTDTFHIGNTSSEDVNHFLFTTLRSTNQCHTRIHPRTPRRQKLGWDVQPCPQEPGRSGSAQPGGTHLSLTRRISWWKRSTCSKLALSVTE